MTLQPAPSATATWPDKVATFLDLIKFAHTIFAMPYALLATFMAAHALGVRGPGWGPLGLIVLCMVAARTYAMTVNRLVDRRFDMFNPRTARRPSVTGLVTPLFMLGVIVLCAACFVGAAALFWVMYRNPWPALLAGPVLVWLGAYSFTKRFTWLCHFWLGVSLGLAPVSAWIALVPPNGPVIAWAPVLLGAAVTLWVGGFDILYALQDEALDRSMGLYSIPAAVGRRRALWLSRLSHLLTVTALAGVGLTFDFTWLYWLATALATGLLAVEQSLVRSGDISRINVAFMTINGIVGVAFGTLGILDLVWR